MGVASGSLVEAVRRAVAEDRTTDVFAATCLGNLQFAKRVLCELELDGAAVKSVDANLQVRTSIGRRVDLEALGVDRR